jgi:cytochrome c-type protein NapB
MKSFVSPSRLAALFAALIWWSAPGVWAGAGPEAPPGPLESLRGDVSLTATVAAPPERRVLELEALIPRTFDQQPPLVPHKTDNQQISLKRNRCLECHDRPNYKEEEAPKIGDSHYRDRAGNELDHVASTRYFCDQCHVSQVDAKPLV